MTYLCTYVGMYAYVETIAGDMHAIDTLGTPKPTENRVSLYKGSVETHASCGLEGSPLDKAEKKNCAPQGRQP